ncbi:MAG: hypothetical protein GZ085_10800 [Sulfuriferula multivorans]|uniref:Uncharacterized protein n=1 Tax=Sulfuriferula multivorans TaxID=1559896 RepID=A0A7C9P8R0_9PROT|nr:hypothetical protein [Sulfuriferula multivorans]
MAIQLNEENCGKLLARKEAIEELAGVGHAARRQDRHPEPEKLTLGDLVHKRTETSFKGVDGKRFKMTKRAPPHRAGRPFGV